MMISNKNVFLAGVLLALLHGCLNIGNHVIKLDELSKQDGYDSAIVYYPNYMDDDAWVDVDLFFRYRLYDCRMVLRDSSLLNSLYNGVNQVIQRDSLYRRRADCELAILAYSRNHVDTIAFDIGPFLAQINGIPFSDSILFWWTVDRVSERDSIWAKRQIGWRILIDKADDNKPDRDRNENYLGHWTLERNLMLPERSSHCYDSVRVYYSDCLSDIRCFGVWTTEYYLRYKVYDKEIIVKSISDLDSLHEGLNHVLNRDIISATDEAMDAFIVIRAFYGDKSDIIAMGCSPNILELNGVQYAGQEVFRWAVDLISRQDRVWARANEELTTR